MLIKGIIVNERDKCCILYFKEDESRDHLFCSCDFSRRLWVDLVKWLGAKINLLAEEFSMFTLNHLKMKNVKVRRIISVIWLATISIIWLTCNIVIFKGDIPDFEECKLNIKTKVWEWLRVVSNFKSSCRFFD